MFINIEFIDRLVNQGGPTPNDYAELDQWIAEVDEQLANGSLSETDVQELRSAFRDSLSPATMQGFGLSKPHGYAGDFDMIDRTYRSHVASEPHLVNWDHYYHYQAATKAVRNRKDYFHETLNGHSARCGNLRVLNIASGPGRCMYEWLRANPMAEVSFKCIEIDPKAIAFASELNKDFLDRVSFTQANILRFKPSESYDLIWASGIFDYFADDVFESLVRRLMPAVSPGGELVIGNFSENNPSRPYMELIGDWKLYHRNQETLSSLAKNSGIRSEAIRVGSEPEGVNLFLHILRHD